MQNVTCLQIPSPCFEKFDGSATVFETEYDDKKDWNTEIKTCRTESCRKVNLTKTNCKANLHAPRICDVVQLFVWKSLQEVSVVIFHLCKLDGDGRVSQVAPRQKDNKEGACSKSNSKKNLFYQSYTILSIDPAI